MTRVGPPRTALLLTCLAIGATCVVLGAAVSPWAFVAVPFAVVVGLAAALGIGLGTSWEAIARSSDDAGSGPAGLAP